MCNKMKVFLKNIKNNCSIAIVSGSDYNKILEQVDDLECNYILI